MLNMTNCWWFYADIRLSKHLILYASRKLTMFKMYWIETRWCFSTYTQGRILFVFFLYIYDTVIVHVCVPYMVETKRWTSVLVNVWNRNWTICLFVHPVRISGLSFGPEGGWKILSRQNIYFHNGLGRNFIFSKVETEYLFSTAKDFEKKEKKKAKKGKK